MPAMSSVDSVIDAARRLADALANPALAGPFARFGAQAMDDIRQLVHIFSATSAPLPTPDPPPSHTRATIPLPMHKCNTDPQAPPRVPSTVPPFRPPISTPSTTVEGAAPGTQATPQVPLVLTHTVQPYSGDRRGERRSLPRGI